MKRPVKYLLLLCNIIMVTNLSSQTKRINPDRPGFLTGTYVVKNGLYLETGYQYSVDRLNDKTAISAYPNINIRFGLADKLEMFVKWDGWEVSQRYNRDFSKAFDRTSEVSLPGAGWKYRLTNWDDNSLTLIGIVDAVEMNGAVCVEPSLAVSWENSLGSKFRLYGIEQVVLEKSISGKIGVLVSGIGLNCDFTPRLQSFAEYFNKVNADNQRTTHGCEFGWMYTLTQDIQVDLYGGFLFHNEAVNYIGFGFSQRLNSRKKY